MMADRAGEKPLWSGDRRLACALMLACVLVLAGGVQGEDELPMGNAPAPIPIPHFPDRVHAFVWRNWESVEAARLAEVLGTGEAEVRAMARAMGLPEEQGISPLQERRGYISVIRRNWQLLPYDQLLTLLGWTADELAYTLKEDDFLWTKLGRHKPDCPPLSYAAPTGDALRRCEEIRSIVERRFGEHLEHPAEPRFVFVPRLSKAGDEASHRRDVGATSDDEPIRFLYSYFAVYGDPLLDESLDPYPDGLLERLSRLGVNGVWLHTVLNQLAPSEDFPEFGEGHEVRLANLQRLVDRAARYGIRVYLYMNEPRSMPPSFFERYPDLKGAEEHGHFAMCTSVPVVRKVVADGLAHVFREVRGLGGIFTITASENLTNCWSRGGQEGCPRCSRRTAAEVIVEVKQAIVEGVRRSDPEAAILTWDWGWRDEWAADIIAGLPDDVYLMSVSEWSLPIERGGVQTAIGEYSMSAAGPGPRATRHWSLAQERGLRVMAKVQVNCTWELSAVPYLPVMNLVAEHIHNLRTRGIDNLMLSWTLGGYPSANLELVHRMTGPEIVTPATALAGLARERFGEAAAQDALHAWRLFSGAFAEFPFSVATVYGGPMQVGPANLLFREPTGYGATMVGFPYDDVDTWRSVYPPEVFAGQFEKISAGWREGLERLAAARDRAEGDLHRRNAEEDLRVAEAAYTHFRSAANQIRFILARGERDDLPADDARREPLRTAMRLAAEEEIEIATRMFLLTREDARIGYEATNHYNYYPFDFVEKVVNCLHILDGLTAD